MPLRTKNAPICELAHVKNFFRDKCDKCDTDFLCPRRFFSTFKDEKMGGRLSVLRKKCIFVTKYGRIVVNDIAFLGQIPERRVVV